jgi:PAS domain S-box-containing protein
VSEQSVWPGRHDAAGGRADDDLLRAFVAATDALVFIVDGAGRILLVNRALERFTGRPAGDLLGRRFWDVFVVPEHVLLAQDAVQRAMATGTAHPQEGDWLTGDGERRRVAMRNNVLADDDGLPYGIASTTSTATPSGIGSSPRSRCGWPHWRARRTWSPASAGTSS